MNSKAFTLENLIAWLEKMPPEKEYDWSSAAQCMLGQWAASCGARDVRNTSLDLSSVEPFDYIALHGESTFGDALERALSSRRAS